MRNKIFITLICFFTSISFAQIDSILTLNQFLSLVKFYHPISKQAYLVGDLGRANLLQSRGGFDPYITSSFNQKRFDEKAYWNFFDSKLVVPTWYGIEFNAGYENWQGQTLALHERTPLIGIPYAGISVSLGKGLFMDERMAILKNAKLFRDISINDQELILNNLFYDAIKAYTDWTYSYYEYLIFKNALELAELRFNFTKSQFLLGEKPAIDTLEMLTVLQARQVNFIESQNDYLNASLYLSNFLWADNDIPVELRKSTVPALPDSLYTNQLFTNDSLSKLTLEIDNDNPILQSLIFKNRQLEIDRTFKINKTLPELDVTYNFLYSENTSQYFTNNYKLGIQLKFPIFFREGIGAVKMANIKLRDNELKISYKRIELRNKVNAYYNDYIAIFQQLKIYDNAVKNYQTLLNAETIKFDIGESSVFMVNSREVKYLEALVKWRELQSKVVKSLYGIYWSIGELNIN